MYGRACFRLVGQLAVLVLGVTTARADVVIDSFDTVNPWNTFNTPTMPGVIQGPLSGTGILGNRTLSTSAGLNNGGDFIGIGTADFGSLSGQGIFDVALNASTATSVTLRYDSFGTLDVSGLAGIGLDILAYNNGSVTTESIVTLETTSGNLVSSPQVFPNIAPGVQMFLIPFADFTGLGSLTGVTAVIIQFNSNNSSGSDITLDGVRFASVPEPASLAAWGLMATISSVGCSLRRRRSKTGS